MLTKNKNHIRYIVQYLCIYQPNCIKRKFIDLTKSNSNNNNKIATIHKNNNRHNFQSNSVNKYQILLLIHKFGKTRKLKPQLVRAMDYTS